MPTHAKETRESLGLLEGSPNDAPPGLPSSRCADFHAVAKGVRHLQEAIGLTDKESLILKYLITNPGRYIDDRQISMLMFGIFDSPPGPAAVQERILGIRSKYANEFGVDPIIFDPERGYRVAGASLSP